MKAAVQKCSVNISDNSPEIYLMVTFCTKIAALQQQLNKNKPDQMCFSSILQIFYNK